MFGRPRTTDNSTTDDSTADNSTLDGSSPEGESLNRPPSTLGGWARAIGWGSLAVVGSGAILLLAVPGGSVGADTMPCGQARDQAGCQLLELTDSATVPTLISTPGQVPFARSPSP